jgi:hypothetical protein
MTDVEEVPLPSLAPNDVVVMGNLGSHKGKPCAISSAL